MKLILYGTSACHLCEMAEQYVQSAIQQRQSQGKVTYEKVDIALDDDLLEKYGLTIPVLQRLDNQTQLGWPFTEVDIHSMIKQ